MRVTELDYELPGELIAQRPLKRRDDSRLLVYRRRLRQVAHHKIDDLPDLLAASDTVVVNDSRVIRARVRARRPGGGKAEVLLVEQGKDGTWEALARPSRKLRAGLVLSCEQSVDAADASIELIERTGDGGWRVKLIGHPTGETPTPPYITEMLVDEERYQTVYGTAPGSVAAPTAGLHFTQGLLERLTPVRLTLHVGPDTFRPLSAEMLAGHALAGERYEVAADAWRRIHDAERVVAVGTTSVRVIETVAAGEPLKGRTRLLIEPGHRFRRVDALLTNFHLPRSTLLALVMAFIGVEETRRLYEVAITERYRFYSFGDAMLMLP